VPSVSTQSSKVNIEETNIYNSEVEGGLGSIKFLLYENLSLFLLTSTFVLLVALLGAAVMTRNKR